MQWADAVTVLTCVIAIIDYVVWQVKFDRDRSEFWARSEQFDKENKIGEYAE